MELMTFNKLNSTLIGIILVTSTFMTIQPAHAGTTYSVGDVFAGVGAGKINEYTPTGVFVQTLETTTASAEQTGMCFDTPGNLYTTDWTAGKTSKFDNAANLLLASWAGPYSTNPESCVVDATGAIYVGEVDGSNRIQRFDSAGTTLLGSWSPAVQNRGLDWIDLAADQKTIFYTSEGDSIKRFDVSTPAGTQLTDFATGLLGGDCFALRILANGDVLVACTTQVHRLNSAGTVVQSYPAPIGATFLFAMNIDPDGTSFWTGDYSTGNIYHIDIAAGTVLGSFTATPLGFSMSGLAVYGEKTVSNPPPSGATAKTLGFYKTHQSATTSKLPQTLGAYVVDTFTKASSIFSAANAKNAYEMLAAQLLATKLNIANGVGSACITSTVTDANSLLTAASYNGPGTTTAPTKAAKTLVTTDISALDNFNNNGC